MNVSVASTEFCQYAKLLLGVLKAADVGNIDLIDCLLYCGVAKKSGAGYLIAILERHGILAKLRMPADVQEPGQATVNVNYLLDLARKGQQLNFNQQNNALSYSCGPVSGQITLAQELVVPELPALPEVARCNVRHLARAIKAVTFKPYIDEDKIFTTIDIDNLGTMQVQSFDGFRVASSRLAASGATEKTRIISEAKLLRAITGLIDLTESAAVLQTSGVHARLKTPLIEVQWPNLQIDLEDQAEEVRATVEAPGVTAEFQIHEAEMTCKSVAKIAKGSTGAREAPVHIEIQRGGITLRTASTAGSADGKLSAKTRGEGSIHVSSSHLLEFLSMMKAAADKDKTKTATLKITEQSRAVLSDGLSTYLLIGGQDGG